MIAALAEIEGDEQELSLLTRRLASILADRLDQPDEALAALAAQAAAGDEPSREAYVELADRAGREKQVAAKLVQWYGHASPSPKRNQALRGAFDRFVEQGDDEPAAQVGVQLALSKGGDRELARQLERIAVRLRDIGALGVAQELLIRDLGPAERALELVRQAEILCRAGVDPVEAQHHGEAGLVNIPPADVEPLLHRLAQLTSGSPGPVIDVYERQVVRCKAPADRVAALARAAQVAAEHESLARAKTFYGLALLTPPIEETVTALEISAEHGDESVEPATTRLRQALAEALSAGGQGARDGGRTRSLLLRRAAALANTVLADIDQAFAWIGDALIAHVDSASLDALEQLAKEAGDIRRAEATLGRALDEVFDGPLVRQLLARRIRIRRDVLDDKAGAAQDLKRLHDVSPGDVAVMDELSQLLTELGDSRGMVHVLEDQILRGRDVQARAELARKVARLWERELDDPREAADAWRRVLRMKPADPEAQAGLERAKAEMLHVRHAPATEAEGEAGETQASATPPLDPRSGAVAPLASDPRVQAGDDEAEVVAPADLATTPEAAAHEPGSAPSSERELALDAPAESGEVADTSANQDDEVLAVDDNEIVDLDDLNSGADEGASETSSKPEASDTLVDEDERARSDDRDHHGQP
jgi:hypothetical protein